MSFRWTDFLRISKLLYNYAIKNAKTPESVEAAYRSSVSRAYYSAYGHSYECAQNHLNFTGIGDGRDHKRLREHFTKNGYPAIKRNLLNLWNWRLACDYKIFNINASTQAKNSISTADNIIKDINDILSKKKQ